ncbi:hypothetical protein GQ457_09G023150 [Hibiscus cannabinus]
MEFYANNVGGDDTVTVRGRKVSANSATINNILDLPNDSPSIYALIKILEDEDLDTIKDQLCEQGTEWNIKGKNPKTISRPHLQPEAKLWNTFVKRNLMPTSHNQTVDRTMLVLINAIITGYKFNVGEVIVKELSEACQNDKGILAFPCIIFALCRRAAITADHSDKYTLERFGCTRKEYMGKMKVTDVTPIQIVMPTPPASEQARTSAPAGAHTSPAATPQDTLAPSPAHTPASTLETPDSRQSTPDSPMGSSPPPPSPSPARPEEAIPLNILQLRSHLQRIEARQLQFMEETNVFHNSLTNFLCFQFPNVVAFFTAQPNPPQHSQPTSMLPPNQNQQQNHPRGQTTRRRSISHLTKRMTSSIGTHQWNTMDRSAKHQELQTSQIAPLPRNTKNLPLRKEKPYQLPLPVAAENTNGPNNAK